MAEFDENLNSCGFWNSQKGFVDPRKFTSTSQSTDQERLLWKSYSTLKVAALSQSSSSLSPLARKPNCRDKNHHTVLWSATGLESPNSPASKRASSSFSSTAWAACSLFLLSCSWTSDLCFAARTLLDFSNSLFLSMLNGYFFSDKYRCILRWKLENVGGSYSPFFPAYVHKKKKLTKGGQARTQVGFQLFDYSSH